MKPLIVLLIIASFLNSANDYIFDFNKISDMSNWMIVDDGVMGGLSQGSIVLNDEGHAVFSGFVTTDNNGGFSSVRYNFETKNVSEYTHLVIRIKGDGKNYQFRIKQNSYDRASYINTFETQGEWETIKIPLKDFYPSFRGYKLNRPNFDGSSMEEIAILIANKRKENFQLEIDSISLE
jgi:hypothetical protein